jgi:hypothetical protein
MKTLRDATRQIILQYPRLAIPKQAYELKDDEYIYIFDFIKEDKNIYIKMQVKNRRDIKKFIEDKSILKRYFSTELPTKLKYLPLMLLGVEYLLYFAHFEDAEEGKKILDEKMREELCKP